MISGGEFYINATQGRASICPIGCINMAKKSIFLLTKTGRLYDNHNVHYGKEPLAPIRLGGFFML